jgi:hypothetical protein
MEKCGQLHGPDALSVRKLPPVLQDVGREVSVVVVTKRRISVPCFFREPKPGRPACRHGSHYTN